MSALDELEAAWRARWPEALALWSRFTRLHDPVFCHDAKDEKREHLTGSFAMIRLTDHSVVVSLRQVRDKKLEAFPAEVLAHEIGHHVLCPADLTDQARLLARLRRGLPGKESLAPLVANLYADLLINDRLQREGSLRMADVYRALRTGDAEDALWAFYMRLYEVLWNLPRGTLSGSRADETRDADAQLGARLARAYARDWLKGAGRFAALCYAYLPEPAKAKAVTLLRGWHDTEGAGIGAGEIPDGLAELDDDEVDGAIHPALDPELSGLDEASDAPQEDDGSGVEKGAGGNRRRYREPADFADLMKSIGVKASEDDVFARYYRELALPHLVRFPTRETAVSREPLPEGLDVWDVGEALADVDWVETAIASPHVVPGVTTVQRVYGVSTGNEPEREPVDLYLGIDCSGSMQNPRLQLSYPVLAGVVMALSALRAGARVMATLSGEPGKYIATDGFVSDEKSVLRILTSYLGTGYAFNVARLDDAFGPDREARTRKAHVLLVTDTDVFMSLNEKPAGVPGWDLARAALEKAGGGGTYVLHIPGKWRDERTARMEKDGWAVHTVDGWEDLVAFAREFSRRHWERTLAEVRG